MTRTCKYEPCGKEFEPRRPHQVFHSDECRYADWVAGQENGGESAGQRVDEGVGSRGGNVRTLDEARDLQATVKAKRDWAGAIDEQIRSTLLATGYFHADDLDVLGVPPEHSQLKGTRTAWFRNQGHMEKTGQERKVSHKAANGRKAPIHRITQKGRRELSKLVGLGAGQQREVGVDRPANPTASIQSGESGVSGTARPSRETRGAGSSPLADTASPETLSLLPEPDPEAWAA